MFAIPKYFGGKFSLVFGHIGHVLVNQGPDFLLCVHVIAQLHVCFNICMQCTA